MYVLRLVTLQEQVSNHKALIMTDLVCSRHRQQGAYVCSFDNCSLGVLLCEECKDKDKAHFDSHNNHIYSVKQFFLLQSRGGYQEFIGKLDKGVSNCESEMISQKEATKKDLDNFSKDINRVYEAFNQAYKKVYEQVTGTLRNNTRQLQNKLLGLRNQLKGVTSDDKDGFFSFFISSSPMSQAIQASSGPELISKILSKHRQTFRIRAQLINVHNAIRSLSQKQTKYRPNQSLIGSISLRLGQLMEGLKESIRRVEPNSNIQNQNVNIPQLLSRSICKLANTIKVVQTPPKLPLTALPLLPLNIQSTLNSLQPILPSDLGLKEQGPYLYQDGVYLGNFNNGNRYGRGKFVYNDGCYYQGYWDKDVPEGMGRIIREDSYYEGEISRSKANGVGKMEDPEKVYTGQWVNDVKQGFGRLQYKTKKLKVEGSFSENFPHGKVKVQTAEYIFEGEFRLGYKHGDGIQRYANDAIFSGRFENDSKLAGRFTFPNGCYYQGPFEKDIPHGRGVYVWADGLTYDGEWANGQQHGHGKETTLDKKQRNGEWQRSQWKRWL